MCRAAEARSLVGQRVWTRFGATWSKEASKDPCFVELHFQAFGLCGEKQDFSEAATTFKPRHVSSLQMNMLLKHDGLLIEVEEACQVGRRCVSADPATKLAYKAASIARRLLRLLR